MDISEILGSNGAAKMRGEVTQERAHMAQAVWDAGVSLVNVGLAAAKRFGRDIPDGIGKEIRTAIERLDGTMARYLDDTIDAATMRRAIRQAQDKAEEMGEAVRVGEKTDELAAPGLDGPRGRGGAMARPRHLAVPWYRSAADYASLRHICADGRDLPDSFEEWIEQTEKRVSLFTAGGWTVDKIYLDPVEFPAWCRDLCLKIDLDARTAFARAAAARSHPDAPSGLPG